MSSESNKKKKTEERHKRKHASFPFCARLAEIVGGKLGGKGEKGRGGKDRRVSPFLGNSETAETRKKKGGGKKS